MIHSRRDFLAATLGAAALSRLGAQPKKRLATDFVTLGKSKVKVTRLCLRHRHLWRPRATRTRPGGLHQPGAPRLRPRHTLLRNRRVLSRHARHARHRAQGPAARQLHPHDEVHHAQHRRPNHYPTRRFPPPAAIGVHRHHADALPAPAHLGDGLPPGAGRALRSQGQEGHPLARRQRTRPARAAHHPRQSVARRDAAAHQPQRHPHGHARSGRCRCARQRGRSGGAREEDPHPGHGRDRHEALRRRAASRVPRIARPP